MTPSEYLTLYGYPRVYTARIVGTTTYVVPANPDRVYLAILSSDADLDISPSYGDTMIGTHTVYTVGGRPLVYSHTDYTTLIAMPWEIRPLGIMGTATVRIAEGYMSTRSYRGSTYAYKKHKNLLHAQQLIKPASGGT